MDWNQKYIEEHNKQRGWGFHNTINFRIKRYRVDRPTKTEHISELEYLIVNYDYKKTLLKRYENIISEETKDKWLDKNLRFDNNFSNQTYNIYLVLIPFYLINPNTKNPKIDKHFLNDQMLLILGGINNHFRKYRSRANSLFEFLIPNFYKLHFSLRMRIIKILILNTNSENIFEIKRLVIINQEIIGLDLVNKFIAEQINRNLLTPKMGIGILRKVNSINQENIENLKRIILKLNNGEYILKKLNLNS
ncbi:MAG: hypothetical protein AB8F94_19705 [Saprospiraceae bacterium]